MAAGFAPASTAQIAAAGHGHHRLRVWLFIIGALLFGMVGLVVIGALAQPSSATCAPRCPVQPPPSSGPLTSGNTFTSSAYGFRLSYDPNAFGGPTDSSASSISWSGQLNSGGHLDVKFAGARAARRSAADMLTALQGSFPDFTEEYVVPGAEIGYVPGAGAIYQAQITPLFGQSETDRMALFSAVRGGVAITMVCSAPKVSDNGEHPNPAELGAQADQFCDEVLNSVTWRGEPPL